MDSTRGVEAVDLIVTFPHGYKRRGANNQRTRVLRPFKVLDNGGAPT